MLSQENKKYLVWRNSATAHAENDTTYHQSGKIDSIYTFKV
jgi:hypothetical protein